MTGAPTLPPPPKGDDVLISKRQAEKARFDLFHTLKATRDYLACKGDLFWAKQIHELIETERKAKAAPEHDPPSYADTVRADDVAFSTEILDSDYHALVHRWSQAGAEADKLTTEEALSIGVFNPVGGGAAGDGLGADTLKSGGGVKGQAEQDLKGSHVHAVDGPDPMAVHADDRLVVTLDQPLIDGLKVVELLGQGQDVGGLLRHLAAQRSNVSFHVHLKFSKGSGDRKGNLSRGGGENLRPDDGGAA